MVTGASSGIGAEFARQLAAAGSGRRWPGPRWPCWSTTPAWPPGATKAFVKELSLGLRAELAGRGVDVCVVFPGPVRTPMLAAALGRPVAPATRVGRWLERGWFMDPSVCVARALAGFHQGRASVVVDPVDRAVVRLPHPVIRVLDGWALRHLTGA